MSGTVTVDSCQTGDPSFPTSSGQGLIASDGSYSLQLVPCTGGVVTLVNVASSASLMGYNAVSGPDLNVTSSGQVVDVTLPARATLVVSVSDLSGAPISNADVTVRKGSVWPTFTNTLPGGGALSGSYSLPGGGKGGQRISEATSAKGEASFVLPVGASVNITTTYYLPSGTAVTSTAVGTVDASGGSAKVVLDTTDTPPPPPPPANTVLLSGRVAVPNQAVGQAWVTGCGTAAGVTSASTYLAGDGTFDLLLLAGCTGGTLYVDVSDSAAPDLTYEVVGTGLSAPAAPATLATITLPDTTALTVTATNAAQEPIEGVAVSLSQSGSGWASDSLTLLDGFSATGRFLTPNAAVTGVSGSVVRPVPVGSATDVTGTLSIGTATPLTVTSTNVVADSAGTAVALSFDPPNLNYVRLYGTISQPGTLGMTGSVRLQNCLTPWGVYSTSASINYDGTYALNAPAGCTGGTLSADPWADGTATLRSWFTTDTNFTMPLSDTNFDLALPALVPLTVRVLDPDGLTVDGSTYSTSVVLRKASWPTYSYTIGGTQFQGAFDLSGRRRSITASANADGIVTFQVPPASTNNLWGSMSWPGGLTPVGTASSVPPADPSTPYVLRLTGLIVPSAGASTGDIAITSSSGTVDTASSGTAPATAMPTGGTDLTGALAYSLTGLQLGATVPVSVTLPEGSTVPTALYKNINGVWVDLSADPTMVTIDGLTVTIKVTDGGLGDSDGLVNGAIVDPLLLADVAAETLSTLRATVPSTPAAPQVAPTGTGVALSWTAPESSWNRLLSYEVRVATKASGPFSAVTSGTCTSPGTRTQCTATLAGGKTYYFQIRAQNTAGWSAWSPSSAGATTVLTAGLKPTFGTVTRKADGYAVNITNYNASYAWNITASSGSVTQGPATGSTLPLVITGLAPGQSATVTATTSRVGYTTVSATVSGAALVATPTAPVNVTAIPGTKQASVSWSAPASTGGSAISKYTATAWTLAGASAGTCSPAKGATTCTISKLVTGVTYWVDVTATNSAGTGPASSPRVSVVVK